MGVPGAAAWNAEAFRAPLRIQVHRWIMDTRQETDLVIGSADPAIVDQAPATAWAAGGWAGVVARADGAAFDVSTRREGGACLAGDRVVKS